MPTYKQMKKNTSALDDDVIEILAESSQPAEMPIEMKSRLRSNILQQVARENACDMEGYQTIRATDDDWLTPLPGAAIRVFNREPGSEGIEGVLSYLLRLEPGFTMKGHTHPIEEETLMLEGDVTVGSLTLKAGDYHQVAAGLLHGDVSTKNGCLAFIRGAVPA